MIPPKTSSEAYIAYWISHKSDEMPVYQLLHIKCNGCMHAHGFMCDINCACIESYGHLW